MYSQIPFAMGFGGTRFNFEDSTELPFVKINDAKVWKIMKPQKHILFLPSNQPGLGQKAMVSDTNLYYGSNLKASFQFKVFLDGSDGYQLVFRHKFDFEQHMDGGIIETSYNNGEQWFNIIDDPIINENLVYSTGMYTRDDIIHSASDKPGFTGKQQALSDVVYSFKFKHWTGYDTLLIRFTLYSDSINGNNEGWMLDDFEFGGWLEDGGGVGIQDDLKMDAIKLYPNPASNTIYINTGGFKHTDVTIIDLNGRVVKSKNLSQGENKLNLIGITAGIYMVKITDIVSGQTLYNKLVKD